MDLVNSELDRDHRPPHKVGGRRLSLRLALVGFFVIVVAYVGVFSGVIAFQILPVVQDMKGYSHRTMAIASTRPPLDHAIEGAIDRAHANLFLDP